MKYSTYSKMTELFIEENRKATFPPTWLLNDSQTCNSTKMAVAGFIYIGSESEPDAVTCFFCEKNLEGWESTDDPWKEHLVHSPHCEFAKMQKPQSKWTVRDTLKLKEQYEVLVLQAAFEKRRKMIKKCFDHLRNNVPD